MDSPVMRSEDVQAVLRLVGGAAELWYTPPLQRQFTLDSLCKLLHAKCGFCCTWGDVLAGGSAPCRDVTFVGFEEDAAARVETFLQTGEPRDELLDALAAAQGRVVTMPSPAALGFGPTLYVKIDAPLIERTTLVTLCREDGAPPFGERDAYLADLCLSEMAWPFTAEINISDPRVDSLQPRLKKVMNLLLQGDSEKQVALKLQLSPHTVHEYVKNLYAELGVCSRGELLAQYVGKV